MAETVTITKNGDVEIAYEVLGDNGGEPLLLVMGLGMQMAYWPDDFCAALVARGFQVARFDNRDAGLSTRFTSAGSPNQLKMLLWPERAAVYRLEDMARDGVAVMDDLGWAAAHVVGRSLGAMVAQTMAIEHPTRVLSLTSLSGTVSWKIGRQRLASALKANLARIRAGSGKTADSLGELLVRGHRVIGSPAYSLDEDWLRQVAQVVHDRGGLDEDATKRQAAAVLASGDRTAALSRLEMPTLVLHGGSDPLMRPVGGRATAAAIPGAKLVVFSGMGHDLPRELWPAITEEIRLTADRAKASSGRARAGPASEPAAPDI